MATLEETYDELASGKGTRPSDPNILKLLLNRARGAARGATVEDRKGGLNVAHTIGGPEALQVYKAYMTDSDLGVRRATLDYALEYGEPGLLAAQSMCSDEDSALAVRVMKLLLKHNVKQSTPLLRKLLTSSRADLKAWSALLLGRMAGPSMSPRIRPLLQDSDPQVQRCAQWAIDTLDGKDVGDPPLPDAASSAPAKAKASSKKKGKAAADTTQAKESAKTPPADSAAPATPQLPAKVDTSAKAPDPPAASQPAATAEPETAADLFRALGDTKAKRTALMKRIRAVSDSDLSAAFRECRPGHDAALNRGAALAAADLENARWVSHVRRLATDSSPGVRAAVAEALGALCTNAVLTTLGNMVADESPAVRAAAAAALVVGGKKTRSERWAMERLSQIAEDKDPKVKAAVEAAVGALGG